MAQDSQPWTELPQAAPPVAPAESPLPTGSLAECVVAMVGTALVLAGVGIGAAWVMTLLDVGSDARSKMVISTLAQGVVCVLVDSTLGVCALAGAIGVSAHLAGRTPRSVVAVARRLWLPWFFWRWAQWFGMIIIVPGVMLAGAVGLGANPVQGGEAHVVGYAGLIRRSGRALGPLAAALCLASVVFTAYAFGVTFLLANTLAGAVWLVFAELLTLLSWLAWAHACRQALTSPSHPRA